MSENKKIGSRMRSARQMIGLTQKELGEYMGVSESTINKYENGNIVKLDTDFMKMLSEKLHIGLDYLMGWDDDVDQSFISKRIPLIGTIAAGTPILAEENIEDYFGLDYRIKADFCLRIKGDSMTGEGIYHDDIVFIKQQPDVENGDIAAVIINGEATLKRVIKANGTLILQPANPKYDTLVLSNGDVWIAGKLMAVLNIKA